jgi:AcrR family transcriptional regulator
LSDITDATGLTKGAIYRHFKSKEDLEKKALYYLSSQLYEKLRTAIKAQPTAPKKLHAMFAFFNSYITDAPINGGCPLMNAAVEADDNHPALRQGALKILNALHESIVTVLDNGIQHGQIKPDIDKNYYATIIFAALEGSIMMSKLRGNNDDIRMVIRHLNKVVEEIEV